MSSSAEEYRQGSITSFLAASSSSSKSSLNSVSSKQKRLLALFDKPILPLGLRTSHWPQITPHAIKNAPDSTKFSSDCFPATDTVVRRKRKRTNGTDSTSVLMLNREEGLRNADVKVVKIKKKNKKVRTISSSSSPTPRSPDRGKSADPAAIESKTPNFVNAKKRVESKTEPKQGWVRKEEPEKDKRTVFVGNVALTVNKKTLSKFFKGCGKVESVRIRSVPVSTMKLPKRATAITKDFHPKRHNMNAYVVFENCESAINALKLNGVELEGLHVRVDLASTDTTNKHDNKRSIFIGNISYQVEEEALRCHFADCGAINNVRIIRDPKTGMGKGFGYVTFEDASSVDLALLLDGESLGSRPLRVHRSTANPQKTSSTTTRDKQKFKSGRREGKMPSDTSVNKVRGISRKVSASSTPQQHNRMLAQGKRATNTGSANQKRVGGKAIAGSDHAKSREEAWNAKRIRKKEIRRKSRELKKKNLGQILVGSRNK